MQNKSTAVGKGDKYSRKQTMGPRAVWPHTHNGAVGEFKLKPK